MRRIVSRILIESAVRQVDMTAALGVKRTSFKRQYTISEEEIPIDLSDLLILSRCPTTREFSRRILAELLAELDPDQLRATDLDRMAESPFPEHREHVLRVLRPLAIKAGLISPPAETTPETP